ncbi:MAG: phosphoribosyltransferase family protein [Bacillota bacterium]|nr:phosphoribosyltransferase family protein [Bacillota bacterium]
MPFSDRGQAGRLLAQRLARLHMPAPVVYGVARGGVVVAYEVAAALNCPLDILVPRKLPSPFNAEVAIGAIAQDGTVLLDRRAIEAFDVDEAYLEAATEAARAEIERRLRVYRGGEAGVPVEGKDAIVVDDGIATGFTLQTAIRALRGQSPASIVLAVPVAAGSSLERLRPEVDEVICLETPVPFYAVGQAYDDFAQVSDRTVIELLQKSRRRK